MSAAMATAAVECGSCDDSASGPTAGTTTSASDDAAAADGSAQTSAQRVRDLKELLASVKGRARWPSGKEKQQRARAAGETDAALAELRLAANDARRLRSGEERRAVTELHRTAEDAMDRVRRAGEIAAPKDTPPEQRVSMAVAAFHTLPLTIKLRVLADERPAVLLFVGSLLAGVAVTFGGLTSIYAAWGCGHSCGL